MDTNEKDEFSVINPPTSDWQVSTPINSYPQENLIPPCPSFGQNLWYDPTNVGYVGYNNGNAEMGLFLPNTSSFLPPSMADSGFIERAARYSLFSDMVNQPESSIGMFPVNNDATEANVGRSSELAKPNVSEDTHSSKGGETSDSKKRKRNREVEGEEANEKSPNSRGNKGNSGKQQTSDPPKDGYIHVRARRGQATNSHSLAERVRREKISERMKFLQDLVPGCNKVTGKAVMLDEIINYVQSLQRQVEFLSMKLATVNPQMDFNLEGLVAKDALQLRAGSSSSAAVPFPQNVSMVYPPLPHAFMKQTLSNIGRTINPTSLSPINAGFKQPETNNGWEGDLHNVIHVNYGAGDVPADPQAAGAATESNPDADMKVEP